MSARVPITLFTNVASISTSALWTDPLSPSNPWNGYPYQWTVSITVQAQAHSDPYTQTPYTYNALDIVPGQWLVFTNQNMTVQIISISSQTDTSATMIVEDVGLTNILNNPNQTGQGIGAISADSLFDCLIIETNAEGLPVFAPILDYSIPVNLISAITNRFMHWNYVQDYIPVSQVGNNFAVGDVIWLDPSGVYHLSLASDPGAEISVGTVTSINTPSQGDFTYRPIGRYVTNLPALPGDPGQVLYVSSSTPGGLTASAPAPVAIPIYIKITDTSAILISSGGSSGSSPSGNLNIIGNSIYATNTNGNINLVPNGNGTVNAPSFNVGNVIASTIGIGTANPQSALHVVGNILISNAATIGGILFADGTFQSTANMPQDNLNSANAGNVVITNTTSDRNFYVTFVEATSGNLGIRVNSTLTFNPAVAQLATSGNLVAASFIPTSNNVPETGMYLSAPNTLAFSTSNTESLVINSNGYVGIGTAPAQRLQVAGNIQIDDGLQLSGIIFPDSTFQTSAAKALTVGTVNQSNIASNTQSNTGGLYFDESLGFKITSLDPGNSKVSLDGFIKNISVDGQSTIEAQGSATVKFANNNGIVITTNTGSVPPVVNFDLAQNINTNSNVTFANISLLTNGAITFGDLTVQNIRAPKFYYNSDFENGLDPTTLLPGDYYYDDVNASIYVVIALGPELQDLTVRTPA